jgi:Ca2+-transporting ATPase
MIFNSFVLMQVFNEINARSIDGDFNVFRGLHKSTMFVCVIIGTIITQVILVELIGRAGPIFKTVPLTSDQWLVCSLMGIGSLPVGILMRIPSVSLGAKGRPALSRYHSDFQLNGETEEERQARVAADSVLV